ncbi:MAG: hypothetical protein JRG70_19320 [Deltaproteobacteria bacterium]|nr:hypothetical protein [Deltaproteobacteria bacterium]
MDDPPQERGRKLHALLDGRWEPDTHPLRLTRALQVEMERGLGPSERAPYEQAVQRLKDWVDSEVAGMSGVADTTGLGHRLAGIQGTIDGLLFPVHRYAGEAARPWMYEVSLFIQMMDDYIDIETDTTRWTALKRSRARVGIPRHTTCGSSAKRTCSCSARF